MFYTGKALSARWLLQVVELELVEMDVMGSALVSESPHLGH